MSTGIDGRVAVVTGGANGIGRVIVERLVEAGAKVVIADVDADSGSALAAELGDDTAFVPTDVTDRSALDAAVDTAVERFGRIDVMVNNAGVAGVPRRFLRDTLVDFDQVMAVDLLACLHGSQAAALRMVDQGSGGAIINTTSLAGVTPGAGLIAYRAAKAGLIHATRCLALELAEHGIRVNAVAPANIPTAINTQFDMGRTIEMTQPLGRHGTPDDVAEAVIYLASAEQVTGVVLPIDGGTSIGLPIARLAEIMAVRPTPTDTGGSDG